MASSYYDSSGKNVVDGDVAYAADLNDINSATDTGFQLVEAAVGNIAANQPYYADLAEKWAENPENTAVEPGKYSALHWAAKADADATQTAADRVQTGLDKVATAADRVQTGLDKVATAADRVQTGLDVIAAGDFADDAEAAAIISAANARGRNYIINGNFDIWQRGTSQTSATYGSDDRWFNLNGGSSKTHSRQSFTLGQTDVPGNPKYFSRTVVTSVVGAGNFVHKAQLIESVISLAGKTATLSFWAKADSAKNISVEFYQNFGTGGSPSTSISEIGITKILLSASWAKYTVTVAIPSVTGKTLGTDSNDSLYCIFWFDAGSNFNTRTDTLGQQSGTFDIAQVQLEEGSAATEFERRTYGQELQLCQRYFEIAYGVCAPSIVTAVPYFPYKVTKRSSPVLSNVILSGGTTATFTKTNYANSDLSIFYQATANDINAIFSIHADAEL